MKLFLKSVFIIAFISFSGSLKAQSTSIYAKSITRDDGIAANRINSIIEDKYGFMWFGTWNGINRYVGNDIKTYKHDPSNDNSVSNNRINYMIEEPQTGNLWVGTENGLNYFDRTLEKFVHFDQTKGVAVFTVCYDKHNNLWVGTDEGLFHVIDNETFIQYKHDPDISSSISSNSVSALGMDNSGNLYIGTSKGLDLYNFTTNTFKHHSKTPNLEQVISIYTAKNNDVWIGTYHNGLFKMKSGTFSSSPMQIFNRQKGDLVNNTVQAVCEDDNNNLYIADRDGALIYFDLKNDAVITYTPDIYDPNSLTSNALRSMYMSEKGILWIGTYNSGVNFIDFNRKPFEHYKINHRSDGLFNNNVRSMFEDMEGNIWIGTKEGGGLSRFNRTKKNFLNYKPDFENPTGLHAEYIFNINELDRDHLLIATYNKGLTIFNKRTEEFTHLTHDPNNPRSIANNKVYNVFVDLDGTIWVASYGIAGTSGALQIFHPETNDFTRFEDIQNIRVILAEDENNLWLGSFSKGLFLYNKHSQILTPLKDIIKGVKMGESISSLKKDKKGLLWVGTDGNGLFSIDLNSNKFKQYTTVNGLPDNRVFGVQIDDHDNIWCSTANGITKFEPESEKFNLYNVYDGLQGNEFELYVSAKTSDGEIIFGGRNGFNIFHPDKIKTNKNIPGVVITDFKLSYQSVKTGTKDSPLSKHISQTDHLELKHDQSIISFEFVALNFTSPEKNQFAYKMEGFDKEWIYNGAENEATYTSLPAGKYTFRVKAANNDGLWNETGTAVSIKILPPRHKTIAFYIFIILLLSSVIYFFVKFREKQTKADRLELENELTSGKDEIIQQREKVEKQAENLKIKEEQERITTWHNKGIIEISNTINSNRSNLDELANAIIHDIVKYIEIDMGAIYFQEDKHIELMGGYALDESRIDKKRIEIGEGLIGTCFRDKKLMKVDNLPKNYALLTSGLGTLELTNLIMMPIIYNERIEGVIELISHEEIDEHKISLVNAICEILAGALINEKANSRIQLMLDESLEQKELLSAHEEELKQNIEELSAIQEHSQKREDELLNDIKTLKEKLNN